jgi:hypothetical protein
MSWIRNRYDGTRCKGCGRALLEGEPVFWRRSIGKKGVFCEPCAERSPAVQENVRRWLLDQKRAAAGGER